MDETKTKISRLLKIKEAAKLLSVHPATLRRWDKESRLVAIRIGSRAHPKRSNPNVTGDRRYRLEDIQKLING
ncbi:MerR family transcriptional regulator [Candidatus Collierbacteria bacterium]|nr:MerR family transcriptional regulator [Candidatus Collierbacteria bacterium]